MAALILPINVALQLLMAFPELIYGCIKALILMFIPRRYQYQKNLHGQTVLITGAGSGIGRQLAIEFSKHSTRLVLLDLNRNSLVDTEKLLEPNTASFVYECDVSNRHKVYEVADVIKRDVGKVDILVNNAGIVSGKLFQDIPDEKIQKTIEVNTLAHFWTCKAFLPSMIESNEGHIVSIASIAGLLGSVNLTDYCASKFGAVGFMEALRMELEAQNLDGVKLTTVCPTVVTTPLSRGLIGPFNVTLTPDYVAQEVIRAVIEEKEKVLLPDWLFTLHLLSWTMPISAVKNFFQNNWITHSKD